MARGSLTVRVVVCAPYRIVFFDRGNTPLHLAVIHKHERLARMLLESGADPRARNKEGKTPIALGSDELVKEATAKYGGGGGGEN